MEEHHRVNCCDSITGCYRRPRSASVSQRKTVIAALIPHNLQSQPHTPKRRSSKHLIATDQSPPLESPIKSRWFDSGTHNWKPSYEFNSQFGRRHDSNWGGSRGPTTQLCHQILFSSLNHAPSRHKSVRRQSIVDSTLLLSARHFAERSA